MHWYKISSVLSVLLVSKLCSFAANKVCQQLEAITTEQQAVTYAYSIGSIERPLKAERLNSS